MSPRATRSPHRAATGRWQTRSALALALASAFMLGIGCSSNHPGPGPGPGPDPDPERPRPTGQSEFETPVNGNSGPGGGRNYGGGDAAGAPPVDPSANRDGDGNTNRLIEEGDIVKLEGSTLYVLNRYRGLQIVSLANPAGPRLLSKTPFYGYPIELYIREGTAYVVVSDYWSWWRCEGADCPAGADSFRGSKVYVVDVSDVRQPQVTSSIEVEGQITDSRIVGDVLYVVSNEYSWYGYTGSESQQDLTFVASINIANKYAVRLVDRVDFPRNGWDNHINVTQNDLFIASPAYGYWDGQGECPADAPCTKITHVDISDPAGQIAVRSEYVAQGFVNDRWTLDFDTENRILRVVTSDLGWNASFRGPKVRTLAVTPRGLSALGTVEIPLAQPETTTAVRFDGNRAYVVTFERIDPLFTVDLSDPATPFVAGELQTPGWLDYIEPRGDRLVALGHDQNEDGTGTWKLQVSLYDVANLAAPRLIDREIFGSEWGWTPGERDDFQKVFRVLDDLGLILVPFTSWEQSDQWGWWGRSYGNVQLIDFDRDSLTLRGRVRQNGYTERALVLDQSKLVALSSEVLDVLDIADRTRPQLLGSLELARNVIDLAVRGDVAVQYVGDYYQGNTALYVVPADDPNRERPYAKIEFPYPAARIFRNGRFAYVVTQGTGGYYGPWADAAAGGDSKPTQLPPKVFVIDLADPTSPQFRGELDLPQDAYVGCGGYDGCWWGWGYGEQIAQVQGSLLALKRDGYCEEYDPTSYACTRRVPHRIYVMDLRDPDAPRIASELAFNDFDWISGLSAEGRILYLSHYESYYRRERDQWFARYYLDRIDLSDPSEPVRLPQINVPGYFVGASEDNSIIYTVEYSWTGNTNRTYLHALELYGDRAYLRGSLGFDGYLNGITLTRSGFAYTTATEYDSRTGQSTNRIIALDLRDPDRLEKRETVMPGSGYSFWGGLSVAGRRLFLSGGDGLLVYDLDDPMAPTFDAFHRTYGYGYGSRVVVANDRAYLPSGYYGVQIIDLE